MAGNLDIESCAQGGRSKKILRFVICGSVDDGKSSLIGRLLHDIDQVAIDQEQALRKDSRRFGTSGDAIEFSLLTDGLAAEREQGITIDVAYRYFSTPTRKFIVADTPGHDQYTRNMATGASVSEVAVVLVDARKGLVTQTRRHTAILHLMGIRHIVLAVNKMDMVDYDEAIFRSICGEYTAHCSRLGIPGVTCIPTVARDGDNVARPSAAMAWYAGPTLLQFLEAIEPSNEQGSDAQFLFPVQLVCRPNLDFRGVAGTIAKGSVQRGDSVVILPAGQTTKIARISTFDGERARATSGDAVTLVLQDEVDVGRGDVIASQASRSELTVTDQVAAHLVWMGSDPMLPGRQYLIKCATQTTKGTVSLLKHKVNVDSLEETAGRQLNLNEIAHVHLSFGRPMVVASYDHSRTLGAFIVIDLFSNETVGGGMIRFGLRRAEGVRWQALDIDRAARSTQKGQRPCCLWFTGLSGAGKSTIANALDRRLFALGRHAYVLDGDNLRHGLNRDLGFIQADRVENVRRVTEVARLMMDAGLVTIVALISPFRAERQMARDRIGPDEFVEIFVDTPLQVCEARDTKGLYARARAGTLTNFTGIDAPYEPPESPQLRLTTDSLDVELVVDKIIEFLRNRGLA